MTRDEAKILINSIAVCYQKNLMPEISKEMIDIWFTLLQDLEYYEAMNAVAALIAENRNYPPTIGAIRGKLADAKMNTMPADKALELIREAIKKFGHYNPNGAREYLGEEIWNAVSRFTWETLCEMPRENFAIYASQFRKIWEGIASEKLKQAQVPASVREKLEALRPKDLPPCLRNEHDKATKGISA